ncbi:MAG: SDR family oxidoreductase [Coleofasciculaceae cyanobacterium]
MNLAIIGCGYAGSAVASYWHQNLNQLVTVTTTRQERVAEIKDTADRVVVMTGNNAESVQSIVDNHDTILVSVAPISNRQVEAEIYAETYFPTANNLVNSLSTSLTEKHLIYLSSCSVYGNKKGDWVEENTPVSPTDKHGQVMVQAEEILLPANRENVSVCILRLGGIYGPERELARRIGRIAGKTLPGTGENFINWVHLDDLVSAVDLVREKRCQGIYNLVDDSKLTLRELCDFVCTHHDLPKVEWDTSQPDLRENNVRVKNEKIKAAGYQLIHSELLI